MPARLGPRSDVKPTRANDGLVEVVARKPARADENEDGAPRDGKRQGVVGQYRVLLDERLDRHRDDLLGMAMVSTEISDRPRSRIAARSPWTAAWSASSPLTSVVPSGSAVTARSAEHARPGRGQLALDPDSDLVADRVTPSRTSACSGPSRPDLMTKPAAQPPAGASIRGWSGGLNSTRRPRAIALRVRSRRTALCDRDLRP